MPCPYTILPRIFSLKIPFANVGAIHELPLPVNYEMFCMRGKVFDIASNLEMIYNNINSCHQSFKLAVGHMPRGK